MSVVAWKDYALRGEDANAATSLTRDDFEDKSSGLGIRARSTARR
jgi:hypothetical protein